MSQKKKYSIVIEKIDAGFLCKVFRNRTAHGSTCEDSKQFVTHSECIEWGNKRIIEIKEKRLKINRKNKESKKRARDRRNAIYDEIKKWSLQMKAIALSTETNPEKKLIIKTDLESELQDIFDDFYFRALKDNNFDHDDALIQTIFLCGKNKKVWMEKALSGEMDEIVNPNVLQAFQKAKNILVSGIDQSKNILDIEQQ